MKSFKVHIIHPFNVKPEISVEPNAYAPPDTVYLVPDNTSLVKWARTLHQIEKERSDWIRAYNNILRGLRYWKDKAESK